jgi:hypothetical protein
MKTAGVPHRDHWLARVALAIGGGYLVASAAAAWLALLLNTLGMARPQAAMTATLAGIVAYLVAALYAFANHSLAFVTLVLIGGGTIFGAVALLVRSLH